jgi:predicted RNase H-like nuclease (RuvC/YqgF family)
MPFFKRRPSLLEVQNQALIKTARERAERIDQLERELQSAASQIGQLQRELQMAQHRTGALERVPRHSGGRGDGISDEGR